MKKKTKNKTTKNMKTKNKTTKNMKKFERGPWSPGRVGTATFVAVGVACVVATNVLSTVR